MNRILSNPKTLLDIVSKIADYPVKDHSIRFTDTLEQLGFEAVYSESLLFAEYCCDYLEELENYFDGESTMHLDFSYRIKTEDSFHQKWLRYLGHQRPLFKVCDDILGIRIISDENPEDFKKFTLAGLEKYPLTMNNFYQNPKPVDDGYRAIHLYMRKDSFPVEIQVWTQRDAVLQFYSHEEVYKKANSDSGKNYTLALRKWIEQAPQPPVELQEDFIEYLYRFVYSNLGGE